jgi:hypothetical protein
MAKGHKTGGRHKGTPNKASAQPATNLAGAAGRMTAGLSPWEIATIRPLDVMLDATRHEFECGQFRFAACIAEKAAPYVHARMAPRAEDGGGDMIIQINGGLPR